VRAVDDATIRLMVACQKIKGRESTADTNRKVSVCREQRGRRSRELGGLSIYKTRAGFCFVSFLLGGRKNEEAE
jgi:hypothetical protein